MSRTVKHTAERNGYRLEVYEYTFNRKHGFGTRITNIVTGSFNETPGFATYGTALMVAQQEAEEAKF